MCARSRRGWNLPWRIRLRRTADWLENTSFTSNGISNNLYQLMGTGNTFGFNSNGGDTLSSWQSWLPTGSGKDIYAWAGSSSSLNLDSTGKPLAGSTAIGAAANLSTLGIAALNYDRNGVARPASGAWDAGAYSTSSNTTTLPAPTLNPPT